MFISFSDCGAVPAQKEKGVETAKMTLDCNNKVYSCCTDDMQILWQSCQLFLNEVQYQIVCMQSLLIFLASLAHQMGSKQLSLRKGKVTLSGGALFAS